MPRLTKQQRRIVADLTNKGWIWCAAGKPYLARVDKEGRVKSEPLHNKTFETMKEHGVITQENGKWVLPQCTSAV